MKIEAAGTFEVKPTFEPPYHEDAGVTLGRARFDKTFEGDLRATSVVHMLYARTPDPAVSSYIALEHVQGVVDGRSGGFAVMHEGHMSADGSSLDLAIVPGTGTAELEGLTGSMTITVGDGVHRYTLVATLPDADAR